MHRRRNCSRVSDSWVAGLVVSEQWVSGIPVRCLVVGGWRVGGGPVDGSVVGD